MKKGRTLCVADIHGNYKALEQVLERAGFDNDVDTLISLGDVVDGHCDSYEVVEKLLSIKNLIAIKGNHDDWFLQWLTTGINPTNWGQGQKATGISYLEHSQPGVAWFLIKNTPGGGKEFIQPIKPIDVPIKHRLFFEKQLDYYLDGENRLFCHAGFNRHYPLEEQGDILWWDRDLFAQALSFGHMVDEDLPGHAKGWRPKFKMVGDYKEVFIGHTQTQFWKKDTPIHAANIWNLDTGAGFKGKLTLMNVETKEYFQSDFASELYPEYTGRN